MSIERCTWRLSAGLATAFVVAACSSAPPPATDPLPTESAGLLPGDAVEVVVWREEDLSGIFRVDERGIVTLPLLGDRHVLGVEPSRLRDGLLSDYERYLRNPSIDVRVTRRINIMGEVDVPGLYPVDATMSLAEALGLAGGLTSSANSNDIRLLREGSVIRQNLDQATRVEATGIRSGDQILVGEKSWISRNSAGLIGSLIAAAAGISVALIR